LSTEPEAAHSTEQLELPLLPRRDTVVFPKLLSQLMVMRPSFQHALEEAISNDHKIVVLARKNTHQREFGVDDLYSVGTVATVGRLLKLPDGSANVWLQGETRVKILEVSQTEPFYKARVLPIEEEPNDSLDVQALMRAVLALFEKAVQLSSNLSDEMYIAAMNADDPGWLADLICSTLNLDLEKRQDILEILDVEERLKAVNLHLAQEVEVLEIQTRISSQVQDEMEKSHREFFLREQMRAIQKELAEVDPQLNEMEALQKKIEESGMPEEAAKQG